MLDFLLTFAIILFFISTQDDFFIGIDFGSLGGNLLGDEIDRLIVIKVIGVWVGVGVEGIGLFGKDGRLFFIFLQLLFQFVDYLIFQFDEIEAAL